MTVLSVVRCGTATAYQYGCRCDRCRFAQAQACRRSRIYATRRGLPTRDPRHGTVNGYNYYGCRCMRCADAIRDYQSERRAARRGGS